MRWIALLLFLALPAQAQDSFVDRLSVRIDVKLGVEPDADSLRPIVPAAEEGERSTVVGLAMAAPEDGLDRVTLSLVQPGEGPRLLLVDAGAVFRGPKGDFVPVPNQKFLIEGKTASVVIEVLPLTPKSITPKVGTALKAVWSNDAGVLTILRTAQRIEAEDTKRLVRYLKETDGRFAVKTFIKNQDVNLAKRMTWRRNIVGAVEGLLPRDDIRFALFAVTADYTLTQTANWLRLHRKLDMEPAIAQARALTTGVEYLLERATLNHRVFSPRHADFHFNKGVAAYARNDLNAATKAFEAALERSPEMVDAQYNLGVIQYRESRYDAAKSTFLVASGMPGANAQVHYNRGATQFRADDKLGAARSFRRALGLNPKFKAAEEWLAKADPEGKTKPKKKKKKKRRRRRRKKGRR